MNQQVIEGSWNQVKGKLRERWGQITDDDLEKARGNVERLVGLIQEKTGEARGEVESYLETTAAGVASVVGRATDAVVCGAQQVAETVQQTAGQAIDSARAGYVQTERLVRNRPVESLAVCFGAGLITGVVIGLLTRSK
ncbi:MAG: CsbD family protein [Planctomycetaceae bacterium]|nr:CsbD family protein [Planctomycetaceae bacterium]